MMALYKRAETNRKQGREAGTLFFLPQGSRGGWPFAVKQRDPCQDMAPRRFEGACKKRLQGGLQFVSRFRIPWNSGFFSAKIGNEYAVFA